MHFINVKNHLPSLAAAAAAALIAVPGCADDAADRVLLVVSNHGQLGDTGLDTGVWMAELTHPYLALVDSELGLELDIASPDGGDAPIDAFSVQFNFDDFLATGDPTTGDPANERFLTDPETSHLVAARTVDVTNPDGTTGEATEHRFVDTLRLADLDMGEYAAIYFAGGNGAIFQFPDSADVQAAIREVYEAGDIVSAACHGTSALLNVRLSDGELLAEGRRVTGFSTAEEEFLGQAEIMPLLIQETFGERGAIYVEAEPWQANVVIDDRLITGQNPPSAVGVGDALATALAARAD